MGGKKGGNGKREMGTDESRERKVERLKRKRDRGRGREERRGEQREKEARDRGRGYWNRASCVGEKGGRKKRKRGIQKIRDKLTCAFLCFRSPK